MNLLLLQPEQVQGHTAIIHDRRRLLHIQEHLALQVGDSIKVGLRDGLKGTATVQLISHDALQLTDLEFTQPAPAKLPLCLIVALPRPKVLRRLVMDAVTLGVEQLIFIHSYRVEKSYWQTPFLRQLDHYIELGLEQAGDTVWPQVAQYKRFRPFVEDELPQIIAGRQAFVAHPYAEHSMPTAINQPAVLVIGPEGGFIPFEINLLADNGCPARSIGERILRTETAVSSIIGRLFAY